jgi:exosortase/archaeosortase family protein
VLPRVTGAGLRFVSIVATFAVAVALVFRDEVVGPIVLPLRVLTARVVLVLVHGAGLDAVREVSALYHPGGFAYEISRGCLGLVPVAFLVVGVLAYPGERHRKLWALIIGVPALFALNLVRLVHLFYLGVNRPDLFPLAHQVAWQAAIVTAVFVFWLAATGYLEISGRPSRSAG